MISGGFDHYEISNFARNGKLSAHNMVYWTGANYMGFGPAAHSYDGNTRSWNISSLKDYMNGINNRTGIREFENLTVEEKYHDYLITTLRTKWGADPEHINQYFGETISNHFRLRSGQFISNGSMWNHKGRVAIHPDNWLISDHILKELFTA